MNVFLSYSRADLEIAERISANLKQAGHEVFFDQHSIQVTEDFNRVIWNEIQKADLFVFLISPNSVQAGSYTLTELSLAEKKWPNPERRVLPVMIQPIDFADIPIYASICHVLQPEGNIAAEVRVEVNRLHKSHRLKKLVLWVTVIIIIATIAWVGHSQYERIHLETIRAEFKERDIFHPEDFIQAVTEQGDFETAQAFIDIGMEPDSKDKDGFTALCLAAHNGDLKALEFLLEVGADINAGIEKGCRALDWATKKGKEDAVRFLLKNGANSKSINKAFIRAVREGNINALKILHNAGVDLNAIGPEAMLWASRSSNSKADAHTIKFLLDLGVSPNKSDIDQNPPLSAAVLGAGGFKNQEVKEKIKVLLDGGADINVKCYLCSINSHRKVTPLMIAVLKNKHNIAEMLLRKNPDLNAECNLGYTALAMVKSAEMMELLQNSATERKIKLGYGEGAPITLADGKLLSEAAARAMIVMNGFFDSKTNRIGKGIKHNYKQQVKANAIIILDEATGLTWLKKALKESSIGDAADFIQRINAEKYAGYSNWRFPTLQEAMALMEREVHEKLYINPIFSSQNILVWTSDFRWPSTAWAVNFYEASFYTVGANKRIPSILAVRKSWETN